MKSLNMKLLKARFLQISLPLLAVLLVIFLSVIFTKKNQDFATPPQVGMFISYSEGELMISKNGGQWDPATNKTVISNGDKIRTGANSKAIMITPKGNIIRMDQNTEILVEHLTDNDIFLTQNSGRAYHKINMPESGYYKIKLLNHIISAMNATLDLSANLMANRINAKIIEGKIDMAVNLEEGLEVQKIGKNKDITVDLNSPNIITVGDISTDYLNSDWYKWNLAEDEKYSNGSTGSSLDTGNNADSSAKPSMATAQNTGNCKPYLTAKKAANYNGILVNWTTCSSPNFQLYRILKSTLNSNPSYPNDPVVSSSSNRSYANFIDKTVAPNRTYYYRACVVERFNKISCGNVASATY